MSLEDVVQRLARIKDMRRRYAEVGLTRQAAKEAIEVLRGTRGEMNVQRTAKASEMDVEEVRQWLAALPVESERVIVYWLDGPAGMEVRHDEMIKCYDGLWFPGDDDVWVADAGGEWLIELCRDGTLLFSMVPAEPAQPAKTAKAKSRIMYVELKSGQNDRGPARIGRITFSKTGRSIYYGGRQFKSLNGKGAYSNYYDVETGEEYWISGCKKNGQDRHPCGGGPVEIDDDVREEYWTKIRRKPESVKQASIR